jgi:hypothetical protein
MRMSRCWCQHRRERDAASCRHSPAAAANSAGQALALGPRTACLWHRPRPHDQRPATRRPSLAADNQPRVKRPGPSACRPQHAARVLSQVILCIEWEVAGHALASRAGGARGSSIGGAAALHAGALVTFWRAGDDHGFIQPISVCLMLKSLNGTPHPCAPGSPRAGRRPEPVRTLRTARWAGGGAMGRRRRRRRRNGTQWDATHRNL